MNNLKEKKLNNKGFSLVELIIVIAIMAVLIGVLAPQYLKYVERSRNSTDQDNASAIVSALQVWGGETDTSLKLYATDTSGTTVTVASTGLTVSSGTNKDAVEAALANAGIGTGTSTTCVSRSSWTSYTVTIKVDADGTTTVTSSIL
jgi:type IV pilus assembly protein PilA